MRSIDEWNGETRNVGVPVPTYTPPPVVTPPPPTVTYPNLQTGGPLPPQPVVQPVLQTGGPNPPQQVVKPTLQTGGPNPPVQVTSLPPMKTGGPNPPIQLTPAPTTYPTLTNPPPATPAPNPYGPAQTVQDMVNAMLGNSEYLRSAQRAGLDTANDRGLLNSNMAAQASRRAAIDAIQPFVSEGMSLLNNREQRAFQQRETQLDRDFRRLLQNDQAKQQDWLNSNQYSREFNGNLSLIPIANSVDFMNYIFRMGAEDPEVFTPNIMTGMQNFFTNSMLKLLDQFFPN